MSKTSHYVHQSSNQHSTQQHSLKPIMIRFVVLDPPTSSSLKNHGVILAPNIDSLFIVGAILPIRIDSNSFSMTTKQTKIEVNVRFSARANQHSASINDEKGAQSNHHHQ